MRSNVKGFGGNNVMIEIKVKGLPSDKVEESSETMKEAKNNSYGRNTLWVRY